MQILLKISSVIDWINSRVGIFVAYLVYLIMGIIAYEVVMRTAFNHPTTWVHDVSGWTQVFYIFLGGAWALQRGYFVRVDVAYQKFPVRVQAAIDLFIGSVLMAAFAYVIIDKGFDLGLRSYGMGETSANGTWKGRVWPAKLVVPIGMILITLAWVSRAIRSAIRLIDPNAIDSEESVEAAG